MGEGHKGVHENEDLESAKQLFEAHGRAACEQRQGRVCFCGRPGSGNGRG